MAILRRHDLLKIEPAAWQEMLRLHPGLAGLPLVADWALRGWPAIVRRRMVGDLMDDVPAALPLPPSHGKRRVAFSFRSGAVVTAAPPVLLADAASVAPSAWRPIIAAVLDLGEAVGIAPRVFGGLLWEHATGLPYLTRQSDLDLLWSVRDEHAAALLVAGLLRLDADAPVRLDGELELPDGGGLNWRELAQCADSPGDVLVKTMNDVQLRAMAGLFHTARGPS